MNFKQFELLISEFCRRVGVEPRIDPRGICALRVEGRPLEFVLTPDGKSLLLMAEVGIEVSEEAEPWKAYLSNTMASALAGGMFYLYHPEAHSVLLGRHFALSLGIDELGMVVHSLLQMASTPLQFDSAVECSEEMLNLHGSLPRV